MRASANMPGGRGDTGVTVDTRAGLIRLRTGMIAAGRWLLAHQDQWVALAVVLLSAIVHAANLFQYPYYHTDEGTYVAQAWAILRRGELAHYTYWYDHAPFGWIQIAAWTVLSQGFYTFGTPIDGGRVLMLVFHCWSTFLVFQIARTISRSVLTATLAGLLFGLSAYGVYYHRRILLDNISTPWMLLSILMIVRSPLALTRVWLSAVALGVSILSKELTIFLVPALGAAIWMRANRTQRLFATGGWLFIVLAIVSSYPMIALLKNEMFPDGTLLGGRAEHVSLIESLQLQAARGRDAGLFSLTSSFWKETAGWAAIEPLLAIGGSIGAVAGALLVRRFPLYGTISLATLALYAFLARGGIILGFYYVPLLPLLALNVALPVGWLVQRTPAALARRVLPARWPRLIWCTTRPVSWLLALLCVTPLAHGYQSGALGLDQNPLGLWTQTQTTGQREAVDWIRRYVHPESAMLVDDEAWVALREPQDGQPVFNNAHWYFKIDGDPEIRLGVFKNDARNVDYVLNTQDVYDRSREADAPLARTAIDASTPIVAFDSGRYPVEIRRVHRLNRWRASQDPMLVRSWAAFKDTYVKQGRVIDVNSGGITTSEAQASAMLRSVYMDDRAAFDSLWAWTRSRLQVRGDGLHVRQYGPDQTGADTVLDKATATAADQDAALALLFAARQWRQPVYQQHAFEILDGIWRQETATVAGSRVIVAGDWARGVPGEAIVSPSSLAPYAYRIFALADARQPWSTLVNSSYQLLTQIQTSPALGAEAGVVPNLVAFDVKTGAARSATGFGDHADEFSADASHLPLRVAVDLIWYGEPRAQEALDRLSLPRRALATSGRLVASYDLSGSPTVREESVAMYAGALPSLLFQGNDDLAHLIFADKILRPAYERGPEALSTDVTTLDDLTWSWYATAFMHGGYANLWNGETTIDWPVALGRIDTIARANRPGLPPGAINAALAAGSARSAIVASAAPGASRGSETVIASSPPATVPASRAQRRSVAAPPPSATDSPEVAIGAGRAPRAARTVQTPPAAAAAVPAASRPVDQRASVPFGSSPSPLAPANPAPAASRPAVRPAVIPIFTPAAPRAALAEYVVQAGDSLLDIAASHGTDVESLLALNGLDDPDIILAGTSLKVPILTASRDPLASDREP